MQNISFQLTTRQFRDRTKTVTRRLGWLRLKAGELLMGCEKCMGRKPGEPLVRLGTIRVLDVRRERLDAITAEDVAREGFPEMTPAEFVLFFCKSHKGCTPETEVTRIEFEYLGCSRDTDGDGNCGRPLCHKCGQNFKKQQP